MRDEASGRLFVISLPRAHVRQKFCKRRNKVMEHDETEETLQDVTKFVLTVRAAGRQPRTEGLPREARPLR